MSNILEKSKLQFLLKKFENDKNKCNYNTLIKFVKKGKFKIKKKIKSYNIILTDEAGVLIYNGKKNNNTWDDYKVGNIKYNNTKEVNLINSSEKNGHNLYLKYKKNGVLKAYFTVKIGSNLQEFIEENGITIAEVGGILIGVGLLIFLGYGYFFKEKIEETTFLIEGETVDSGGSLITISRGTGFSANVPISELTKDDIDFLIDSIDQFEAVGFIGEDGNITSIYQITSVTRDDAIEYLTRLKNSLPT